MKLDFYLFTGAAGSALLMLYFFIFGITGVLMAHMWIPLLMFMAGGIGLWQEI